MSHQWRDQARVVDFHVVVGDTRYRPLTSAEELLSSMDSAGVAMAIVGASGRWAAVDNEEGNRALVSWADRYPTRFRAWATVNPWFGQRAVNELLRALDAGAVGIKLNPALQGFGLLSPHLSSVLDVAADRECPLYVVTGVPVASEPLQLCELARRRPEICFVMGRSGRTDFSLDFIPALLGAPNIVAETAYNGPSLIRDLVAAIGSERVVFSSDAPLNEVALELARVRDADLSESDLDAVLRGSAARIIHEGAP